jgi:hypothetical protein
MVVVRVIELIGVILQEMVVLEQEVMDMQVAQVHLILVRKEEHILVKVNMVVMVVYQAKYYLATEKAEAEEEAGQTKPAILEIM